MDTSEKYIEMCKAATNLLDEWIPADGDFYVYSIVIRDPQIFISSSRFGTELVDTSHWIRILRQDQLQNMLSSDVDLGYLIVGFAAFYDPEGQCGHVDPCSKCKNIGKHRRKTYDTMEQWWLAFVIYEKFDKEWDGNVWTERKC